MLLRQMQLDSLASRVYDVDDARNFDVHNRLQQQNGHVGEVIVHGVKVFPWAQAE